MYLKTLTLRGFKSFASATTLNFEPGITCVVGPNGSGKSNVVDALSWVMGEQGAKSLRGGNMADVIFAGTSSRPPLGRAEVSLTIDNSDGALPIDYTEVTISRTLFRNGGSEYAINGTACRLLDIQELLSDTGMGREMHVIVGQGQLDTVLSATPEDRRAFIEEAAGVLKHRRRKEKALRKLDSMEANVARLTDLVGEIRRQLGPLARQAEVARKAHVVQAELRDAKTRLLADDLVQLLANLAAEQADEAVLKERREAVDAAQTQARTHLAELESAAAKAAPEVNEAAEMWFRLSSVRERLRGTATLAQERIRLLGSGTEENSAPGRDPDDLDQQAERARAAQQELRVEQQLAADALAALITHRQQLESAAAQAEKDLAAVHRVISDRREGVAQLTGRVSAQRSRLEAVEAEIERLRAAHTQALIRTNDAQEQYQALERQAIGAEAGEEDLKQAHQRELRALDEREIAVNQIRERERKIGTELAAWEARRDALNLTLARQDATGALVENETAGILGLLADDLRVEPGYENAIAAVLGQWADAAIADSLEVAAAALRYSRETEAGIASLIITRPRAEAGAPEVEPAPFGEWAGALVRASERISGTVAELLRGVVVVESLTQAQEAAAAGFSSVTREGDLISATVARGGRQGGSSTLELHAVRDEAEARISELRQAAEEAQAALAPALEELQRTQSNVEAALAELNDSGSTLAGVSRKLAEFGALARSSSSEGERAQEAIEQATDSRTVIMAELTELTDRLDAQQAQPQDPDSLRDATTKREGAAEAASAARGEETDARLTLRTVEERMRALTGRVQSLERAARTERLAREAARERARKRAQQAQSARIVSEGSERVLLALEGSLAWAQEQRDALEAQRKERDAAIIEVRRTLDELVKEYSELTDVVHKDEVARASQLAKIDQLQSRSIEELGLDPEILVEEFGPHNMVPVIEEDHAGETPYVRAEQEKRLRKAERALALLGRVNPLALEEHKALAERHAFLSEQLADIQRTRVELLGIVREIDERVERVFADAFADTAREFVGVFAQLFPGGEGKLVLTDPSDMLTTGIDVEARPAGKKVRRLSLLSGGERSLTAVAMLIAIFKARPSPFYVMDEVEAALDDANLGRLIEQFADLKENSQLIVITHQKRTMEVADALYGVTMRGDGVSTVISQRMKDS